MGSHCACIMSQFWRLITILIIPPLWLCFGQSSPSEVSTWPCQGVCTWEAITGNYGRSCVRLRVNHVAVVLRSLSGLSVWEFGRCRWASAEMIKPSNRGTDWWDKHFKWVPLPWRLCFVSCLSLCILVWKISQKMFCCNVFPRDNLFMPTSLHYNVQL